MNKFNILQLMTDSKIGGAEKVVLSLATGLSKERFNVYVCSLTKRGLIFEEMEAAGVKVYSLGMRNIFDFFKIFKLIRILKSQNIQILHSHLFHANILARIVGKLVGVPIIISTEHIMGLEGRLRLFLNRLTSIFVDRFVAVSFGVENFLVNRVGISSYKITVIQNGIDSNKFNFDNLNKENRKKEFGFVASDKIVGTIARIHKQKGHIYLLQAAKEVIEKIPEAKFLIVGDGPLKKNMEKLSKDLKIAKNVIFLGFCKDIPSIMSILDILVLPSLWEGLPITILEAMAMKKPVIATRVGGTLEVVENDLTGVLVEPKDCHSLSQAIIRLLRNVPLMDRLGKAGYTKVTEYFNIARMLKKTEDLYNGLIEEKMNVKFIK